MGARRITRSVRQRVELTGRRILIFIIGLLFGRDHGSLPTAAAAAPGAPLRILIIRLDPRLGNAIMTLPIIDELAEHFPKATIDMLSVERLRPLLKGYPRLHRFFAYHKRRIFAPTGPLRTLQRLRAQPYDLILDGTNPTDPSTTQALLIRFSGARITVGPDTRGFGSLYHLPYTVNSTPTHENGQHEVMLRLGGVRALQLLTSAGDQEITHEAKLSMPRLVPPGLPAPSIQDITTAGLRYAVLNVGARLFDKRLRSSTYGALADRLITAGLVTYITYGPKELTLARAVVAQVPGCALAPQTSPVDLAHFFKHALCTITCDTGPMHVAVAVGCPTAAIFLATDPLRYGYPTPHLRIDARNTKRGILADVHIDAVAQWVKELEQS